MLSLTFLLTLRFFGFISFDGFEKQRALKVCMGFGTLKRDVWYFEEGSVLILSGRCSTLKTVVCYF